ncbi:MAG: hypothetical protein AABP62_02205 [Planctomycetota bacterium]
MLLFHQPDNTSRDITHGLFAVFGVGLIGSAVTHSLGHLANWRGERMPLSWDDADLQGQQLGHIACRITHLLDAMPGSNQPSLNAKPSCVPRFQILWSAGRAGFGATEAEAALEMNSFSAVAEQVQQIASLFPQIPVTFHHISSAGGLFEGQRGIRKCSVPSIRRPYGFLKLSQEMLLNSMGPHIIKRIYRLTSIIGPAVGPHRRGLVGKLIDDGLHHRTTCLVGLPSTLRDYVWHSDVGRHIAECVLNNERADTPCTHILASAKPSSIHEVIDVVESIFGRRLYTKTSPLLSNDVDTTVSPEVLPAEWCATDLFTCTSRIYRDALAFEAIQHHGEPRLAAKETA